MKFKDELSSQLDKLEPSAELRARVTAPKKRMRVKKLAFAAIAAVLSLAIVVTGASLALRASKPNAGSVALASQSGESTTAASSASAAATVPPLSLSVKNPASASELFASVKSLAEDANKYYYADGNIFNAAEISADAAEQTTGTKGDGGEELDYSETNLQVAGVDEADVIKTDGRYIYVLAGDEAVIVGADGGNTSVVSRIDCGGTSASANFRELYIKGDRLILLGTRISRDETKMGGSICCVWYGSGTTVAAVYDISNRAEPKLVSEAEQSGFYVSSRMIGGVLYTVSTQYNYAEPNYDDPTSYMPYTIEDGECKASELKTIFVPEQAESGSYIHLTALNTAGEVKYSSELSILGCGSDIFVSTDNIYVYCNSYVSNSTEADGIVRYDEYDTTELYRVALNGGELALEAECTLKGTPLNQFSFDEYGGYLRVVLTESSCGYSVRRETDEQGNITTETWLDDDWKSETANSLCVLDMRLDTVGTIADVAPGERVYSVRFTGDVGYFVTFRQVDPLFAVDLSDPASPELLSALKIPGFSQYLHPFGDGLLFGFGQSADDDGRVTGLKLSMFDTSNPADVTEASTLVLDADKYGWSEASYNHKAILIDAGKNLICIPTNGGYLVFAYENGEFRQLAELGADSAQSWRGDMRGLYINGVLYVSYCDYNNNAEKYVIEAYNMADYSLVSKITY